MNLEVFEGKTMAAALAKVKQTLGPDALIVNTRTYRRGPGLGRLGSQIVEITAAKDNFSLIRPNRDASLRAQSGNALTVNGANRMSRDEGRSVLKGRKNPLPGARTVQSSRTGADRLATAAGLAGGVSPQFDVREVYQQLIESQVATELADQLVRRLRTELTDSQCRCAKTVRSHLAGFVASMVPIAPPPNLRSSNGPMVIALVGATGVGKTTTIAKLAAQYALRARKRVGLMTTDTVRIGAVDQLRIYADVLGVDLHVVGSPDEASAAMSRMAECDVILIDTPGRNPQNSHCLADLQRILAVVKPHETHLVLPGTGAWPVLHQTISGFASLGVNRIIVSKLDEAVGFGVIVNCLQQAQLQLSYLTTGQSVYTDIEIGASSRVADLVIDRPTTLTIAKRADARGQP